MSIVLRPYQEAAIAGLRTAFADGFHSPLLVSPTGSGKTVMFSYLTMRLLAAKKRVVILAHREELLAQISETLTRFDVAHGVIRAGAPYDGRLLAHVASVQTVARRLDRIIAPDYVIPDEAHHATAASQYGKCLVHWRAANPTMRAMGVTATPERLSGEGLGETFDTMVMGPTTAELIELGALAPYRLFAPKTAVDLTGIRRQGGDFARGETAAAMDKPSIIGDAVGHYRKLLDGCPAVAFCVSVAHAEHTAEQFRSQGYRAVSIDGKMDKTLRRSIVADFGRGAINVLTSADLISEGFDCPGIVGAILLRPTHSLGLYLQQVGRALRTSTGKTHAIILDHVKNSVSREAGGQGHGMPDAPREWSLIGREAGKSKAGEAAARQCPHCFAVSPSAAAKCRECGQAFPIAARVVEVVDGELSEVDIARAKREAAKAQAMADSVEALTELGRIRGMSNPEGWARHVMRGREMKAQRERGGRGAPA